MKLGTKIAVTRNETDICFVAVVIARREGGGAMNESSTKKMISILSENVLQLFINRFSIPYSSVVILVRRIKRFPTY